MNGKWVFVPKGYNCQITKDTYNFVQRCARRGAFYKLLIKRFPDKICDIIIDYILGEL